MALRLYNTRTRRKETFVPRVPGRVGMYVCGLTVYDHAHIGHARTAVSFEVIRRWLEHRYPGELRFVQNVTDVEDKIIARAAETGVSPREHARIWDLHAASQMSRLGVRMADACPHVTDNIPGIIHFIEGIVAQGFAYATAEGNVYFDVPGYDEAARQSYPTEAYGSLSNRDYREMTAGTRKEVETDKRHPADFALWKAAKSDEHPDANWSSPWGRGRPGWHIECSLMATDALGDQIDIHGGGQDLVFPHHENEVAQSQAKTGKAPFVNVWMHTGFLNVEGEKMSKSLNNFITLQSALDELEAAGHDPELLRFYFVQTHYRSKIDYAKQGLTDAATALARLHDVRARLHRLAVPGHANAESPLMILGTRLEQEFASAMDDDVHTPGALAALFDFARNVNRLLDQGGVAGPDAFQALRIYETQARHLTLLAKPVPVVAAQTASPELQAWARGLGVAAPATHELGAWMEAVLARRQEARKNRDWKTSDAIRDEARTHGILIEDSGPSQRWRTL